MIDLRRGGLPHVLTVAGEEYEIETSFRAWIEAERQVREDGTCPYWVYKELPPITEDWQTPVLDFLSAAPSTPRAKQGAPVRVLDLIEDGAYIVAAFQQAYGIDLTDKATDMHWHRFRALLMGLPQETQLSKIMGYRSYDAGKARRKQEAVMNELRTMWALPRGKSTEDALEMQQQMFGSIEYEYKEVDNNG